MSSLAIDTTFLIDLYWEDSPRHKGAVKFFKNFANKTSNTLLVYYNCFNEFIHVITDTKRFENAFSMEEAINIVDEWRELDRVKILFPFDESFGRTVTWLKIHNLGRKRLNDTNMASRYELEGATEILTANPKGFECIKTLRTVGY